jgi:polyhydroxybutyrate depolymerase
MGKPRVQVNALLLTKPLSLYFDVSSVCMKKIFFFLFVSVMANAVQSQTVSDSVLIEGHYRSFYFKKPAGNVKNQKIIFIMHGSGGNGTLMMEPAKNLQAVADSMGFFLVYPNGYKNYWNECRKYATSAANKEDINEPAFFNAMLGYFNKNYSTNKNHFFCIGLSGGGHMSYKLAMTMPEKCAGITAVVASLPDSASMDCVLGKKPLAVLIANGTKDGLNKYEGGDIVINGSFWGVMQSTEQSFHYWAALAGYTGQPVAETLPDPDPNNGQTINRYSYNEKGKPAVVLLKVIGGEHAFPKDIDIFITGANFFIQEIKRLKMQ